jgi:peroxiredoxin
LRNIYQSVQEAGAEMIALAVAPLASVDGARNTTKATYPMLADPEHQVAEAYGVYNLLGDKLAAPSVFIIGADGRVVWNYVGENSSDRPNAQTILEHLP